MKKLILWIVALASLSVGSLFAQATTGVEVSGRVTADNATNGRVIRVAISGAVPPEIALFNPSEALASPGG